MASPVVAACVVVLLILALVALRRAGPAAAGVLAAATGSLLAAACGLAAYRPAARVRVEGGAAPPVVPPFVGEKNVAAAERVIDEYFAGAYVEAELQAIRDACARPRPGPPDEAYDPGAKPAVAYRPDKGCTATSIYSLHRGQRKLFLGELQCLLRYAGGVDAPAVVLYAGSAPGVHLPYLAGLFPRTEWHLYDPAPFDKKVLAAERFHAVNDFFTDETAREWAGRCDIFICDIRLSRGDKSSAEFEDQVSSDMAAQARWLEILRPRRGAMLKFRPPYVDAGAEATLDYAKGEIYWQAWPPRLSTETRLMVDAWGDEAPMPRMALDVAHYQDACASHNLVDRVWATFPSALDSAVSRGVRGYCRCADCALEVKIWEHYAAEAGADAAREVPRRMNELTRATHQNLVPESGLHGKAGALGAGLRMARLVRAPCWNYFTASRPRPQ